MAEEGSQWLIISYFINEEGMACSHHIDDRLPELRAKGILPTLLSSFCMPKMPGVRHLRAPSISPSGIRFEVRQALKRRRLPRWRFKLWETLLFLPLYPLYLVEKLIVRIDTTWFWFPAALIRGTIHCLLHRPAVVYSTGGPACAHLVGAVLASWSGAKWLAEFQDPLIHSYCARSGLELRLLHWVERVVCRKASRVIFLTEGARKRTEERSGVTGCGGVIFPGARPLTSSVDHTPDKLLRFVHVGSLGGSRHLRGFLSALALVLTERPELQKVVRFSLLGSLGAEIVKQVNEFPYESVVSVVGRVPREQAVAEMQHSDVLLLLQNEDDISAETIPSKAYEYFHAHRLILALVYRNEELRQILLSLGHIPVSLEDPGEVREGILSVVDRWETGKAGISDESPYTVSKAVEMLVAFAVDDNRGMAGG